ncbi:hypothetical protein MNB_SV-6-605 [hydrothermal vent metagenome]|uniref:Big-1 domain-containing protein n=1 Tax=hydrothermal vent metagenome TaxID=652676 RepID=A0A1W1CBX6_9ZZZZ
MKKTALFSLIAIFVVSIIAGCGSNTKADPVYASPYQFVNASTPIDVDKSDSDYNISVQLVEDGFGFSGQTVKMRPFDSTYGTLLSSVVETDDSGWAYFLYHSPKDLTDLKGQTALMQAVYLNDDNETEAVQDFVLSFSAEAAETEYRMTNQSTPIIVDSNDSAQTIFVYIVDGQNVGVEGETVTTSILDQRFGSISPSSVKTDAAGKASFAYAGPSDITPVIGQQTSITLRYEKGGKTSTARVDIQIVAPQ